MAKRTKYEMEQLKRSGEHIKKLRNKKGIHQKDLAELLHIGVSTLRTYEKGQYPFPPDLVDEACRILGTYKEYLLGETEKETKAEFIKEWNKKQIEMEFAADEALAELEEYKKKQQQSYTDFFEILNLGFECFEDTAACDFYDLAPDGVLPFKIIDKKANVSTDFTREELEYFIQELQSYSRYLLYKKIARKETENAETKNVLQTLFS